MEFEEGAAAALDRAEEEAGGEARTPVEPEEGYAGLDGLDAGLSAAGAAATAGGAGSVREDAAGVEAGPKRDFRAELEELLAAYPDALRAGALPEEVKRAALGGKSVLLAYAEHRLRQAEEENRLLRQNMRNLGAAPVRGSGGAAPAADEFVRGFDSDY